MDIFKYFSNLWRRSDDNSSPGSIYPNNGNDPSQNWPQEYQESDRGNGMGFNVFTDPLEMHRYFESQVNEAFRAFGFLFGNVAPFSGNQWALPPNDGTQDNYYIEENPNSDLRSQYLRPGYNQPQSAPQCDISLDGQINANDIGKMYQNQQTMVPYAPSSERQPAVRSFLQTFSRKTITRGDGGVETQQHSRDAAGMEQVTVIRRLGDEEYSVTTKTDAEGRQERIENFSNMDEKDLSKFMERWNAGGSVPPPVSGGNNWGNSFFGRFF